MRTLAEVSEAFTPIGKLDTITTQILLRTEILFRETATELFTLVPECADRTAAFRKLLEAKMTCVQAITHDKNGGLPAQEKREEKKEMTHADQKQQNSGNRTTQAQVRN